MELKVTNTEWTDAACRVWFNDGESVLAVLDPVRGQITVDHPDCTYMWDADAHMGNLVNPEWHEDGTVATPGYHGEWVHLESMFYDDGHPEEVFAETNPTDRIRSVMALYFLRDMVMLVD